MTRNCRINIRLSKKDKELIKKKALEIGLSQNAYIRKMSLLNEEEVIFLDQNLKNFLKMIEAINDKKVKTIKKIIKDNQL